MPDTRELNDTAIKFLNSLPPPIAERVEKLRDIQQKCDVYKNDFLKEKRDLEEKYRLLLSPLYNERSKLIVGENDSKMQINGEFNYEGPGAIPCFWLRVLKAATMIGDHITHRDEPILKFLLDLSSEPLEDGATGFKLVFKFGTNPYFGPLILEKRYYLSGDDEMQLEKTEGTDISWNPDKNPAYKVVKKKSRGSQPPKTKLIQTHSFFDFFTPPEIPDPTEEEEMEDIAELLAEDDLELGSYMKEIVIPNAVSWYTGELPGTDEDDDNDDNDESSTDDDESSDD